MRALETRRRVNENQIYPVQMITYLICITDKQNNNNNNKFHQLSVLQDCGQQSALEDTLSPLVYLQILNLL